MSQKPVTMIRNSGSGHGPGTVERVLRQALAQPGNVVADAAGWDASNTSRFLSGQQGVPIGKLDAVLQAAGYVIVSRRYFDATGVMAEVGMYCRCAREGGGECGPSSPSNCAGCQ